MMKRFYLTIFMSIAVVMPAWAGETGCSLLKFGDELQNTVMSSTYGHYDCQDLNHIKDDNSDQAVQNLKVDTEIVTGAIKPHAQAEHMAEPPKADQAQSIHHNSEFNYQIDRPNNASGDVVILLHGSGGNEKSLMPFARSIWPRATLVGIRGRIVQKGQRRWYKKITATKFDQNDVNQEAEAFVSFLTKLTDENDLDVSRSTFIGYSNGANLLAVVLLQQPDLVRRAVLMRSMPVLDKMPRANLNKTSILTLSGQKDRLYSPFAPVLSSLLKNNGAKVESHMVAADHMIGNLDKKLITAWIGGGNSDSLSAMSAPAIGLRSTGTDRDR